MSAKSGARSALGVGISTLVTIIVAVLLTTFAVLTLVTARADLRLSTRAIESTQNYYEADSDAEIWLTELDAFVNQEEGQLEYDWRQSTLDAFLAQPQALTDLAASLTAAGYNVQAAEDESILVTETFPIDDRRELVVKVLIGTDGRLSIHTWQVDLKR